MVGRGTPNLDISVRPRVAHHDQAPLLAGRRFRLQLLHRRARNRIQPAAGAAHDHLGHLFAAFAKLERKMISDRTKAALAQRKAAGARLGNPTNLDTVRKAGHETQRRSPDDFSRNTVPIIRSIQASGLATLTGIAGALNDRGVPTARGARWHPETVRAALNRAI